MKIFLNDKQNTELQFINISNNSFLHLYGFYFGIKLQRKTKIDIFQ